jgi:hypothetical protein
MDVIDAARRWAGVWERAWAVKDVEAIVALRASGSCRDEHGAVQCFSDHWCGGGRRRRG